MIVLFRLLARLPLPLLHAAGVVLGWLLYATPGRHAPRIKRHLYGAGLETTPAAYRKLLRRAIAESGKAVVELLPVWLRPLDASLALVRSTLGWHDLDAARAAGRGVIVVCPHLGCFEMVNLYCAARHPFTAMYKPQRHPLIDALMQIGRQRGQSHMVPADVSGVRGLLSALKRGEAIGLLPDQVASGGDGTWVEFFGRPAYSPTLAARLAHKSGAAVFLVVAERLSWGRGFRLHAEPVEDLAADKVAATAQLSRRVEDAVRRYPAQYLWSYNRYKRPSAATPPPEVLP